jgi:hypothetical protein
MPGGTKEVARERLGGQPGEVRGGNPGCYGCSKERPELAGMAIAGRSGLKRRLKPGNWKGNPNGRRGINTP